ncbi:hypothetical protein BT69DRAFT_1239588 [Atractiella rhizophila]|nr:hypothetical protein BT69DRAFT_1239588 [Atractiella rhizophila]
MLTVQSTVLLLASVGLSQAWFRVSCVGNLLEARVDPVVSPGIAPTQHTHTIQGAKNFRSNSTYDTLRASSCSNCLVVPQDFSNYWFPKLYFIDPKGGFDRVPDGGLLVYYQNRGDADPSNGGPGLKAFPKGFKMRSGNPTRRARKYPDSDTTQAGLADRATFHSCIGGTHQGDTWGFPAGNCPGGLNSRACWDGKNVAPLDNSHVAYLSQIDNGKCPDTHPVPLMKLFYEVTWDIDSFVKSGRWDGNGFPFTYAPGDPTGYGWHADFQNGWDLTALQNAIDHCNSTPEQKDGKTEYCPYLTVIPRETADLCRATAEYSENVQGPFARLPGCNPLQYGPGDVTLYTAANCPI